MFINLTITFFYLSLIFLQIKGGSVHPHGFWQQDVLPQEHQGRWHDRFPVDQFGIPAQRSPGHDSGQEERQKILPPT